MMAQKLHHVRGHYPRSGNHIVRTLMEVYSGRPTLGCPENPKDIPIFEKSPNQQSGLIKITDPNPIGYKAHRLCEVLTNQHKSASPLNLLLVTRNPVDAISSHLARSHRRKGLMLRHAKVNRAMVRDSIDRYMSLVFFYQSFQGRKMHLKFQDIVDETWHRDHLSNVVGEITGKAPQQLHNFRQIMTIAKESQDSLRQDLSSLKADISAMVSDFINYETVLDMIDE